MDERTPERVGRFDDFGGKLAYPPKGWVMTADGWKQIQRPPWSVRNEYPTAYPYLGPVLGSALSTPAAAALAAANAPRIAVNDKPEAVETRTHRVVADKPLDRFATLDAELAAFRKDRRERPGRRIGIVAAAPVLVIIACVLTVASVLHMVAVGVAVGALRVTLNQGLTQMREAWSGLFDVIAERWTR